MRMARWVLILAGSLSCSLAALHVVIAFVGGSGYRYFGAGESMARQAEQGSLYPAVLTLCIAFVLLLFGLYAFSGADLIRRLPLIRSGLLVVGGIYFLRGLLVFPQLVQLLEMRRSVIHRAVGFSLVSLILGVGYLVGTAMRWKSLNSKPRPSAA